MFEKASRLKIRFNSDVGMIMVEDLWDFNLASLNSMAKILNRKIKESAEENFLADVSKDDELAKLKFDIVLHVLKTKKEERDKAKESAQKKIEKEKLLAILEKKQDANLEDMSEDEIKRKIAELE